jgi:uncharacterized ferritin-like protein (DUF455 family)
MEIREFARRVLAADTLEEKLLEPGELTDHDPGVPLFWKEPTRPTGMGFTKRGREQKLPSFQEHKEPDKIAICLHRFAGHELLAVEIMAHALMAFPKAPPSFRKGLANTLKEEQGHVRLYMKEMERFGLRFGQLPLYKHFWAHIPYLTDPIAYVSTMSLTFEMANLDFAPMYRNSFAKVGDLGAASLMDRILNDEIAHVRFGWQWLKRFKGAEQSEWDAWQAARSPLLSPKRAKGFILHEEHRQRAGVSEEWMSEFRSCL